jgi:hypothetical protein
MHDPLDALRSAGCPVDHLSAAQRAVLAALTEQETAVLVAIQHRLRDAEGDVVAHNLKML